MTRRYNRFLLYRRLLGEHREPVYRPVRSPETLPDQCELDHGDVVEVHQVDDIGSLPVAHISRCGQTVTVEEAPFTEEQAVWSLGPGRDDFQLKVPYPWGYVRVMEDRVLVACQWLPGEV